MVHLITNKRCFEQSRPDVHFEVPRGGALGTLCGVGGGCSLWSVGGSTLWGVGGAGPSAKKKKLVT